MPRSRSRSRCRAKLRCRCTPEIIAAAANREVAGIAEQGLGRFIPFAFVHAERDAGRIGEMVAEAVGLGFRGIKVHRKDAAATREVCETAQRFRLPVLYDVFAEMALLEMLVPQYPEVTFIIPHLGSFADDWRAHRQLIDQMARFPNLYADTSAVKRFDYLVEAVKRVGPRRIIFGTDGPWTHPGLELEKIRLLGLPAADEALITGGNILRLIGPEPAGRRRKRGMEAHWRQRRIPR